MTEADKIMQRALADSEAVKAIANQLLVDVMASSGLSLQKACELLVAECAKRMTPAAVRECIEEIKYVRSLRP